MDKVVFYIGSAACLVIVWVLVSDWLTRWRAARRVRQIHQQVKAIARETGVSEEDA